MDFKFYVSKVKGLFLNRKVIGEKNNLGKKPIPDKPGKEIFPHTRRSDKTVITIENSIKYKYTTIELIYNPHHPQSVNVTIGEH
jgi:hypothetical protein